MQIWGKNRASGILGQAPATPVSSPLGKLRRNHSQFPADRMPGGALSTAVLSQAGWGENDYVGLLVIRKESWSPLSAGCFIWSQKIGLASTVCTELVDKRPTPKGNGTLACKDEPRHLTLSASSTLASGAPCSHRSFQGLCLSL